MAYLKTKTTVYKSENKAHRCGIPRNILTVSRNGQVKMWTSRVEMIYRQDECYDAHGEVLESPPTSWEKEHYPQTKKKPPKMELK